MIKRLLAAPPFHFVVIGAVLYSTQAIWAPVREPIRVTERSIVISSATLADLQRSFSETAGRAPNTSEIDALVRDHADNEILYREALARRLDEGDRSVKWRLVQKMQFLGEASAADTTDDAVREALYREALTLGLDRDDLIIRRLLIEKMRLLIKLGAVREGPTEDDLQRYYEANAEDYRQPARVSLQHVFLSADERGERLQADAQSLLAQIREASMTPAAAVRLGDVFSLGHELRGSSEHNLAKLLGSDFARSAIALTPDMWHGPIASAYGLHLIWVEDRWESSLPGLDAVRTQVLQRYLAERREAELSVAMARLREQYTVAVAGDAVESAESVR